MEAATRAGISQVMWSRLEIEGWSFRLLRRLQSVAEALGVELADLIRDADFVSPAPPDGRDPIPEEILDLVRQHPMPEAPAAAQEPADEVSATGVVQVIEEENASPEPVSGLEDDLAGGGDEDPIP